MKKTSLVVLAAGMGSRYGGLKQIDKIGPNGEIILELSVYDAIQAGFNEVVFIIKKEMEEMFKEAIGNTIEKYIPVKYVYQQLDQIPQGCSIPEGRVKPWGTGHALLCCEGVIDSPFAIINADDYYGRDGFVALHNFLTTNDDDTEYAMVGYHLVNTLSNHGSVARGVCTLKDGYLTSVDELVNIVKKEDKIAYSTDDGATWNPLAGDRLVSLNMWGFKLGFIDKLKEDFKTFFMQEVPLNPMKSEYFIPKQVDKYLQAKSVCVKVLESSETWYGVTYQEDKEIVEKGIKALIDKGLYPVPLWQNK